MPFEPRKGLIKAPMPGDDLLASIGKRRYMLQYYAATRFSLPLKISSLHARCARAACPGQHFEMHRVAGTFQPETSHLCYRV